MDDNKRIKEINHHISDALEQWADIMLMADADEWSHKLTYSRMDVLNAIRIANHVLQNFGIKSGMFTLENANEKASRFRESIEEFFGLDTRVLAKEQIEFKRKKHGN